MIQYVNRCVARAVHHAFYPDNSSAAPRSGNDMSYNLLSGTVAGIYIGIVSGGESRRSDRLTCGDMAGRLFRLEHWQTLYTARRFALYTLVCFGRNGARSGGHRVIRHLVPRAASGFRLNDAEGPSVGWVCWARRCGIGRTVGHSHPSGTRWCEPDTSRDMTPS